MSRFDWPALLRAGVRGLGLRPAQFWQLTPVELRLMLGIDGQNTPMDRAALDALEMAYPDENRTKDHG